MSAVWVLRPPTMTQQWPVQYHGDEMTAKAVLAIHRQANIDSTLTRETLLTPAHAAVIAEAEMWATARTNNPPSQIECYAADDLLAAVAALRAQQNTPTEPTP